MSGEQAALDFDARSSNERYADDYRASLRDRAKSTGLQSARVGDPQGFELALGVVRRLALSGCEFTADTVRVEVPIASNAVGAAFRHAAREGSIEQVGYVPSQAPSRHGAIIRLWRGSP